MYATADWSATPRPMYPADGRKIPDHYAHPPELHDELDAKLGPFPLFKFWGPAADITSSRWIAARHACTCASTRKPTLTLCYLPHLDYNLQRLGPDLGHPAHQQGPRGDRRASCGELIDAGRARRRARDRGLGVRHHAGHRRGPHQPRAAGGRADRGPRRARPRGAGPRARPRAFAVADHQVAHVYRPERSRRRRGEDAARRARRRRAGPGRGGQARVRPRPSRAPASWWRSRCRIAGSATTTGWTTTARPDFARTVDIHRKPGYDPVELFVDPALRVPHLAVGWRLLKRKLGLRTLLDVISPKDTRLVKGSHGRITDDPDHGPLVISSEPDLLPEGEVDALAFKQLVLDHVFGR